MSLPFDESLWPMKTPALLFDIALGTYSFRNTPETLLAQDSDGLPVASVLPLADRREADETDCEADTFLEFDVCKISWRSPYYNERYVWCLNEQ